MAAYGSDAGVLGDEGSARVLSSASPEVWGPPTWQSLHFLAAGYPKNPTPPVKKSCDAFLRALPWMLPCESCGYHLRKFLRTYPGGAPKAASCREALQCFLVDAHNSVRLHTRPGQRPWTQEEAAKFYEKGPVAPGVPPLEWAGASHLVRCVDKSQEEVPQCSCSPPGTPRGSEV